jgi:hypothetical protein
MTRSLPTKTKGGPMRLEERCPCGGEIVLVYDAGRRHNHTDSEMEAYDAHKQLDFFRRRHKGCLASRPGPMYVTPKEQVHA